MTIGHVREVIGPPDRRSVHSRPAWRRMKASDDRHAVGFRPLGRRSTRQVARVASISRLEPPHLSWRLVL
jgi:hypothetical protein